MITTTEQAVDCLKRVLSNVEKVIVGKRSAIELVLITLACKGHILIEDVPGVGKTSLVSALAKSVDASFKRIQFTPDIMPSDITGFSVFNPATNNFEYRPGAVMSQFILADEINRTSPKTQSSLLEVMEESQVTVDGHSYAVPKPFIVLATQNPVDYLGTYPLPEAQLDRFFMKISMGYPTAEEEGLMLERFNESDPLTYLKPAATNQEIIAIQQLIEKVHVSKEINDFIVKLTRYSREHSDVTLGASPRASLCLFKAAQARALYNNQNFVSPDDVIAMAPHVLEHRIILKQEAKLKKVTSLDIINDALKELRPTL